MADRTSYERVGSAAVLTIERPERRNAVDRETADELLAGYREFEADDDARVMVLTGAGELAFCAGADLKALAAVGPAHPTSWSAATWTGPRDRWASPA